MYDKILNIFIDAEAKNLARRILKEHVLPYRRKFALAVMFMILAAIANSAIPFLLQPVFDNVFQNPDVGMLFLVCGGVFAAFLFKGIASFGESVIMTDVGQKIITDMQSRLFAHLMKADLAFFHQTNSGDLLSRFTNDVNQMRNAVATALVGLGKDFFSLTFLIALMFYRDWVLAAATFVLFPSIILPIARIGRRVRKVADSTQSEMGLLTTQLTQVFQGIRMIKAYGLENHEIERTQTVLNRILGLIRRTIRIRSASHPIVETLGGLSITTVIAYGGWQVMHHARTTGEFISFIGALILAYEPLKRLSNLNANIQEGLAAGSRVFATIDILPTIVDKPTARTMNRVRGDIYFDQVTFQYAPEITALKKITLSIPAGSTVALVGHSGSGKSTFVNLIPRFYDVTEGTISIDGHALEDFTLASLRQQIALVSQEITLFDDTVFHNIAYGCLTATHEEVMAAAQSAAAHDFIMSLPQGYDTIVGENGVNLSGGQRQRIAIARAMLKNAPILLLDEATSALDTQSERLVQTALTRLMAGRTTLVVAHRLSTIVDATCIYVLNQGEIVESGSHHELLALKGHYAQLWQTQSSVTIPDSHDITAMK